MRISILIFTFFIGFAASAQWDQPERPRQASSDNRAVKGKVAVDGAAIYVNPDFDSEVIDYLNQGTVVPMSVKQYPGPSGLGLFHKVKTPAGKIGYITDTDITSAGKEAPRARNQDRDERRVKPHRLDDEQEADDEARNDEDDVRHNRKAIFLTHYMGGSLSMIDYTEKFGGSRQDSWTPFAGFRLTGPGTLIPNGLPTDLNIGFYPLPPAYLKNIGGTGSASGLLALGDLSLFLPFSENRNSIWTYGAGLMWTFSDYKVTIGQKTYNSEDFRVGVDVNAGYGYRFDKNIVRADLKFYIEKTQYLGAMITYQREM